MIIPHSAGQRSYGEANGKQWSVSFDEPAPPEQENIFYGPRFSTWAETVPNPVVYVSSALAKAEFATVYYGAMRQQRGAYPGEIPSGHNSLKRKLEKQTNALHSLSPARYSASTPDGAINLGALLSTIGQKVMRGTLDALVDTSEVGTSAFSEGSSQNGGRVPLDTAQFLLAYALPGKRGEEKGSGRYQPYTPNMAAKGSSTERIPSSGGNAEDGIALPQKKTGVVGKINYGNLLPYNMFEITSRGAAGEAGKKYDFRQVWSNIEVSYSFTIGKNDNPFAHFIDYDSLRPRTHGSAIVAAKSYYHKIRRQLSSFASFEGHFN